MSAATFHRQLREGVAGTGRGRWAQDFDGSIRQRRVDILPGFVGVGDKRVSADRVRHFLGECQENVPQNEIQGGRLFRIGDSDTVIADFYFDDVFDTVFLTGVEFGFFDRREALVMSGY